MRCKLIAILLIMGLSGTAQAGLIDRGDGLIYDDILDVTWLQDAGLGGDQSWNNAMNWAAALDFADYDDWRLPSLDELAQMYDILGGGTDRTGDHAPIQNVQRFHWSDTVHAPDPDFAWGFAFDFGDQSIDDLSGLNGAWAVRTGDIRAAVAEPRTLALMGLGLAGLGWARRRERSGRK